MSPAGDPVVIEFAGPSCSGKTTLIRQLERDLVARGVPAQALTLRKTRTRRDFARALLDPRVALWCALNARRLARHWTVRRFIGTVGASRLLRRRGGIVLVDEGALKLFPDMGLKTPGARALLAALPPPDALVVVRCEPRARLERMRREDRKHARRMSDAQLLAQRTGDILALHFAATRGIPAIEVDTSPGSPAVDLLDALAPWLRPATGAAPPGP